MAKTLPICAYQNLSVVRICSRHYSAIRSNILRTVEARFAKLLLDSAEGDVIERRRWTNQTELAAHLVTVPDVLSRVIRELTKAGLIEMDKQHIRILNRAGLAERAMLQGD
jgi:CRP-like cAMP-binding protein